MQPNNQALSEIMSKGVKQAFEEDREILNLVQQGIDEDGDTLNLAIDAGAVRFRKRLGEMIEQ